MKLNVRLIDMGTMGVLLNHRDAANIGVLDGDRVQIDNLVRGLSATAVVTRTSTLID
jgi:anaerobic selenocysteine-containing dehydrogenase